MLSRRYESAGLFVLLAAIWGTSFVAARAALPDVPPVLLAAFRFDIAAVLLVGYAAATTPHWRPTSRADWSPVLVGGVLFVAAHHALLFVGQQYVTSAVAAVVIALDPVLATVFASLLLADGGLSGRGVAGLLLGLVGVGVVASPSPDAFLRADVVGVGFVFLAAAAFALGAVLTRRTRSDMPVRSMQGWMMAVGAPLLHLAAVVLPSESLAAVEWSVPAMAGLGYLAVVAAGVGYLIYFELLDRLGPVEINLVAYVAPVFAALGGWLLLGEGLDPRTAVGFLAIATGFLLVKWDPIRTEIARLRRH